MFHFKQDSFKYGVKCMMPVIPGIIPFGLIMGSVATAQGLTTIETMLMNSIVFAGASQLAVIDLVSANTPVVIIIFAGLIINLRFLLYSAANTTTFRDSSITLKILGAYLLTDQSYAVVSAKDTEFKSNREKVSFYFGASISMLLFWNLSVLIGCFFGNIVPPALSLDFAVPLSFMALTIPTLKTKNHLIVAIASAILSIIFYGLPLKLGLMTTAILSICMACLLIARKGKKDVF